MKQLSKVLLATIWFLGAISVGLTVHQSAPQSSSRDVEPPLAEFAVQGDQIVLVVEGISESRWRLAAPAPTSVLAPFDEASNTDPQEPGTSTTLFFILRTVLAI